MNTTTLVTASTILDPAVKSEKKKVKILIEHIHKSYVVCSQRKKIRFAVI